MTDVMIRFEHVRKADICSRGARDWFQLHGLDYVDFLRNGIPASHVAALNDAFGNKVVEIARQQAQGSTS